ncbi:response regulator [Rhodobacter sp. Har01]|uniref:response regulator n=1 Tax=Rhodobacter sp. Har01 TaxID=2883999 RepID=UPI001D05C2AD|nr:response regulator [Rhodobacter sp. Har01]MCB6178942.1 response regulator [Rhodobacter sp. Har01]
MPRPDQFPDPAGFVTASGAARTLMPLQGLTVLAVEDSRYACDALRLMCQRLGARLRRADSLATAEAHLRCYRPDLVIVDLGLPDGRGEALIGRLALSDGTVVLGTSGDPCGRPAALAAGAAGFLDKPIASLAVFQETILAHLPDARRRPAALAGGVEADPLALTDDLIHAAEVLEGDPGPDSRNYLAGFLSGLARQSQDAGLAAVSAALRDPGFEAARLTDVLRARIVGNPAFAVERP